MFPGKSEEALLVEVQELFDKMAKLVFIVGSIDRIFDAYVVGRGLIAGSQVEPASARGDRYTCAL